MSEQEYLREMLNKLLSQSEETQRSVTSLDKKVDLHIQKTELQLDQIHKLDEQQNAILEEHHKRSDRLAYDNELREKALKKEIDKIDDRINDKASKSDIGRLDARLEKIERPKEFQTHLLKFLAAIGTVAGAAYSIYQFFLK
jgi:ubiquinone biosynthesis protein UbiJ